MNLHVQHIRGRTVIAVFEETDYNERLGKEKCSIGDGGDK